MGSTNLARERNVIWQFRLNARLLFNYQIDECLFIDVLYLNILNY